jgi:hypothetical protein
VFYNKPTKPRDLAAFSGADRPAVAAITFLVVGTLGFVPGVTRMHTEHEHLSVHGPGHGMLLGLFHVNLVHNLLHIAFGVAGILCSQSGSAARGYARFVAIAYGLLVILGLISAANTNYLWGLAPIHGHDVWLHALVAAASAYFGFVHPSGSDRTTTSVTTPTPP